MRWFRVVAAAVAVVVAACSSEAASDGGGGGGSLATTTTAPVTVSSVVAEVAASRIEATLRAVVVGERSTAEQRAATRATLRRELESAVVEVREEPFGSKGGVNLLGRIAGRTPGAGRVLVSAHYDTVPGSPGADDNGSGVAAAVEVGRVLADARPELAIELAFFDLEELGLLGSLHHVRKGRDGIVAAFNLDMVGYSCTEPGCQIVFPDVPGCMEVEGSRDVGVGIAAVADAQSNALLDDFVAAATEHATDLEVGTARLAHQGQCLADTRRSDHAPLWDADVPTVFLTDTANFRNPHYHKPSDTLETVDVGLITTVTRALTAAVATRAGVGERG